jgi:tetratricopeptide (TPR) repeat protein
MTFGMEGARAVFRYGPDMLTLLLTLSLSHAGTRTDLTVGALAFEQQDYDQAIVRLQTALSEPVKLRASQETRAHLLLGRALLGALTQAAGIGDFSTLSRLQDAPLQAAEHMLIARDRGVAWGGTESSELALVQGLLMQGVIGALASESPGVLEALLPWADMAVTIGGSPLALDLRGQLQHRLGRGPEAYADYRAAMADVVAHPPERPELLIAYTAWRAAAYAYEDGDRAAALAHLDEGIDLLEQQWARIPAPDADQHRLHDDALADLGNFRLDILLNSPEMIDDALASFEEAVRQDPDSYVKTIAYAQLLEQRDPDAAAAAYARAIALDPDRDIGHFNLGALHVNRAVALLKAANEETDMAVAASLQAEGRAAFLLARPHLERALVLEPGNREAIRALKQIAIQADDIEAYRRLEAAEAALESR